jgi:hypothetical protein
MCNWRTLHLQKNAALVGPKTGEALRLVDSITWPFIPDQVTLYLSGNKFEKSVFLGVSERDPKKRQGGEKGGF